MSTRQLAQSIRFAFEQCRDDESGLYLQAVVDGMIVRNYRTSGEGPQANVSAARSLLDAAFEQIELCIKIAQENGSGQAKADLERIKDKVGEAWAGLGSYT